MLTQENRGRYDRSKLGCPSDLTDAEWALVAPLIPPGKQGGRKRRVDVREVVNGLMYILSTGCSGARFPKACPPEARFLIISTCGTGMVPWAAFMRRSM